jgi:hypothetical protein
MAQVAGLDTLPTASARSKRAWVDWLHNLDAGRTEAQFAGRGDDLLRRGNVTIGNGEETYEARLRIRRPDGTVGGALRFSMAARYEDNTISERGADETGCLTVTIETDLKTHSGTFQFSRSRFVGEEVDVALPSIEFLNELHAPNVLQASWGTGSFVDYWEIPAHDTKLPDSVMDYLRSLSTIQTRVSDPILIPDLTRVTSGDVFDVNDAAALVSGETLRSSWTRFSWVTGRPRATQTKTREGEIDLRDHYQLAIFDPLTAKVGKHEYTLGTVRTLLLSARFVDEGTELRAFPFLNDTMERTFDPITPVPERSNRPVQGKSLGRLADSLPYSAAKGTQPRRHLRAAGVGRSGQHDISERIEEMLAAEVRQSRQ